MHVGVHTTLGGVIVIHQLEKARKESGLWEGNVSNTNLIYIPGYLTFLQHVFIFIEINDIPLHRVHREYIALLIGKGRNCGVGRLDNSPKGACSRNDQGETPITRRIRLTWGHRRLALTSSGRQAMRGQQCMPVSFELWAEHSSVVADPPGSRGVRRGTSP
jgi:hypothetical protein